MKNSNKNKRILTGIQPSGALHLGNYFGAIKQMRDLQDSGDLFIFIANYHALTSLKNPKALRDNTIDAAINFLSLGIDPNKTTFYLQSDIKEVLELYWILSGYTPMGLLERAHSFKDKVAKGVVASHSLFSYPVLMAADILLYDANIIPVGKDQIQHVEITRDIAIKFNNDLGNILTIPEFKVTENLASVVGTDGAKMSKSYKNTIDIFSTEKELKKMVGKITTDSTPLEDSKDWSTCSIFSLAKLYLNKNEQEDLKKRYEEGAEGYGHFKNYLKELIWDYYADAREKREYYLNNKCEVYDILRNGAKKADSIAKEKMELIRDAVGIL